MASNRQSRSSHVGAFLAAAVLPRTFQRSLLPRSTTDQGAVSGVVMSLVYAIAVVMQDGIDAMAGTIAQKRDNDTSDINQSKYSFLLSIGAIGAGLVIQNIFKQKPTEKLNRSSVRTLGYWLTVTGIAGSSVGLLEHVSNAVLGSGESDDQEHTLPPLVVPLIGALIGFVSETSRPNYDEDFGSESDTVSIRTGRAIGMGLGIAAMIAGLTAIEEKSAHSIDTLVERYLPALNRRWLPLGHLFALGGLASGMVWSMRHIYRRIESGANQLEPAIADMPASSLVSGCQESNVSWKTMSVQGRRHIADQRIAADIESVMGEWAQTPVRVFVGFDSAPTESQRVELALAELLRTGAYDREFLVVVSPTGTGYVNYIFSESVEYLSRGNCASVTIQYSKRPSPLSLDQVPEGRYQYRKLLNGIRRELKKRPENARPKIILFGESLGAWTSQDAFMNEGTDGFEALNIHRALWIGTPAGSKWKEQVLYDDQLNTNRYEIGVFNDYDEYDMLPAYAKDQIKFIMLTHYNDPVAHFDSSLLFRAPPWLAGDRSKRPTTVPKSSQWRSPTTFIQTLVDMKNALKPIPGQFVATGHDYRGDLANFVAATLGVAVTDEQMQRVEAALRVNEKKQAELLASQQEQNTDQRV